MKCIKHEFGSDLKQLKLIVFSDLHIGSPKCDMKLIQEYINQVKNDKNCYYVILGDLLNNSTRNSVGDPFVDLPPMQQMEIAISLFSDIKDKCLGITSGNHEYRSMKECGTDLMYFFANELGLVDRYDIASCVLFLRFGHMGHNGGANGHTGKTCYAIYISHGTGATSKSRLNGLEKRSQIVQGCDVVIIGHTHNMVTAKESYFALDRSHSRIKQGETTFVNAGSFLDYETYAELYGYKPTVKGSPTILLSGQKHKEVKVII